jgi:hypothetical protein
MAPINLNEWLTQFCEWHDDFKKGIPRGGNGAIRTCKLATSCAVSLLMAQRLAIEPGAAARGALRVARAYQIEFGFPAGPVSAITSDVSTSGLSALVAEAPPTGTVLLDAPQDRRRGRDCRALPGREERDQAGKHPDVRGVRGTARRRARKDRNRGLRCRGQRNSSVRQAYASATRPWASCPGFFRAPALPCLPAWDMFCPPVASCGSMRPYPQPQGENMRRNRGFGVAHVLAVSLACTFSGAMAAHASDAEEPAAKVNPIEIGVFGGIHFYNKDHGLSRDVGDSTGTSPDTGGAFGLRLGVQPERVDRGRSRRLDLPDPYAQRLDPRHHSRLPRPDYRHVHPLGLRSAVRLGGLRRAQCVPRVPTDAAKITAGDLPRNRDTDGFFHVGVGAKFPINDMFGLRLDGRAMAPAAIAHKIATVGTETGYGGPDFEVLLSGYVGFGAEPAPAPAPTPPPPPAPKVDKDTDGDGIPDSLDKCPNEPEDKDGFQDEDGCPDPDNDGDGILDKDDKCPNEPEDKDGFQDEDGCPDPDNDGDGIPMSTTSVRTSPRPSTAIRTRTAVPTRSRPRSRSSQVSSRASTSRPSPRRSPRTRTRCSTRPCRS